MKGFYKFVELNLVNSENGGKMVVKLTNPICVEYIRSFKGSVLNAEVVENALCEQLGLEPRKHKRVGLRAQNRDPEAKSICVHISDPRLISYIDNKKKRHGVLQRHTAESAILNTIKRNRRANS